MAGNPQESRQGVGGGVDSPQATNTPGWVELPLGDETPGVTTTSKDEPGEDRRGQGGYKTTPPPKQPGRKEPVAAPTSGWAGQGRQAPPRPQRGMAAENGSVGTLTRHSSVTNGIRPENGALACRKYGLLAPTGTAVNSVNTGNPGSEDGHEATGGLTGQDGRETEEGDETWHDALLDCAPSARHARRQ